MGARLGFVAIIVAAVVQGSGAFALEFKMDEAAVNRLEFSAPESRHERAYLGLSTNDTFRLSQIKTQLLLVEIFNMYCPICQGEAPKVNELHGLIQKDPVLKAKVRFIGIGIGNTPFEVDVFRKKFGVSFPLVPDESFSTEKISKERIRTPTFLILDLRDAGGPKVIGVQVGRIQDVAGFAKALQRAAGQGI